MEMVYKSLETEDNNEPMMNILCSFQDEKWRLIVFPRGKQRSSHFYSTGDKQIVVSPAAVEMGGVLVLPAEENFRKITQKEIAEIYGEVTINSKNFRRLILRLRGIYR